MKRKLNEAFLADYCVRFCEQISASFFSKNEVMDGASIVSLTPSRQVNFFILKTLFTTWQEEMKRLESPYFNFRDPEVRSAMVSFMNLLSKRIEIHRQEFDPLLGQAVDQTVRILLDPAGYTVREFDQKGLEKLSGKTLKNFFKYVKVYRQEFEELLEGIDDLSLDEFSDLVSDYFEDVDPEEELRNHLHILSEVVSIRVEDLLEAQEALEMREEIDPYFEEKLGEGGDEELADNYDDEEKKSPKDEMSEASRELIYRDEPEDEVREPDPAEEESARLPSAEFEEENEPLLPEQQATAGSILEAISINNRYLFTKVLFGGDKRAFETAVGQVDRCDSFDGAVELIIREYAKTREWDMNSDEVKEFLKVVFRRFR